MKAKASSLAGLLIGFALAVSSAAPAIAADAVSGTWTGDWGPSAADRNTVIVELKWDGKALSGSVNPGPNAIELQKCTFDARTGVIHMEADAKSRRGTEVHYVIDGKVEGATMSGSWDHGSRKGDFKITRK